MNTDAGNVEALGQGALPRDLAVQLFSQVTQSPSLTVDEVPDDRPSRISSAEALFGYPSLLSRILQGALMVGAPTALAGYVSGVDRSKLLPLSALTSLLIGVPVATLVARQRGRKLYGERLKRMSGVYEQARRQLPAEQREALPSLTEWAGGPIMQMLYQNRERMSPEYQADVDWAHRPFHMKRLRELANRVLGMREPSKKLPEIAGWREALTQPELLSPAGAVLGAALGAWLARRRGGSMFTGGVLGGGAGAALADTIGTLLWRKEMNRSLAALEKARQAGRA